MRSSLPAPRMLSVGEPGRLGRCPAPAPKARRRPRVVIAGAFDRFNYGDLLFAHTATAALREAGLSEAEVEIQYGALRDADLRSVGGVEAFSLDSILAGAPKRPTALVVAGGEVLHARWTDAYSALTSAPQAIALKVAHRLGVGSLADRYSRRALCPVSTNPRPLPWILEPSTLQVEILTVAYAGVGGCRLDQLPPPLRQRARRGLGAAGYLSVRDAATAEHLKRWQLPHSLAPDPAGRLTDLLPPNRLSSRLSPATARWLEHRQRGYLLFQASRYLAWGHEQQIADSLLAIAHGQGLDIALLALGRASAHEDDHLLRRVAAKIRSRGGICHQPPAPAVADIAALIAGSALYAGTSLHGNLTALAYARPRVALSPRVHKLTAFLASWDPAQPGGPYPFSELTDRAQRALAQEPGRLQAIAQSVRDAARADAGALGEHLVAALAAS
ncbi:MAG: polysaccharide pyruvyl transferase family protein [Acidobacteriota bacterium]